MLTKRDRFLITAVYLLACAAVWPFVRFYVDNPDSFQYLAIAEHIIKGKWQYIFNGYWSPLISWLLAPFLVVCKDGITAFKYLQIGVGLFSIRQWLKFIAITDLEKDLQKICGYAIIPFVVSYSLLNLTPDLLFVAILLSFIIQLILWLEKRNDGSDLGKFAVALYLTKAFGLILFFVLFVFAWRLKGERIPTYVKKKIVLPFVIGCGSWMLFISISSGHFTISEAARFNMTYEVAPKSEETVNLPVLTGKLLPPSNPEALSAWEEPASQIKLTPLNPIKDPGYYFEVVKRNLLSIYYGDFRRQVGEGFLLMLILYLLFRNREKQIPLWVKFSLAIMIVMYGGYSLILVHARYVWICSLLFIPTTIYFVSQVKKIHQLKYTMQLSVIAILIFGLKRPIKDVLLCGDKEVNALQLYHMFRSPSETMEIFYRSDIALHNDIDRMKSELVAGQNFATLDGINGDRDPYSQGLMIAYECKGKYFGRSNEIDSTFKGYVITNHELEKTLMFDGRESGLRIYQW